MALSLVRYLVLIAALASAAVAGLNDPFPMGYGMGNQGTIVWQNGIAGRQPWTPAAWYRDSLHVGCAAACALYYDAMDNFQDASISQIAVGAFCAAGIITVKAAFEHFNAFDLYSEQTGRLSIGAAALRFMTMSIDAELLRASIGPQAAMELYAGETVMIPLRYVGIALSCRRMHIARVSGGGFDLPAVYSAGFHTPENQFGAQGIVLEIIDRTHDVLRLVIGEEYRFTPQFALCAAVSTNPVQLSFGISFNTASMSGSAALVDHPVLGWSKGFGLEWAR